MELEKGKKLVFEWTAPPFAAKLNVKPLPIWIEVSFEPLPNNPAKTHVRLAHHGFKRSQPWDKVYEFFVSGWASILYRLDLLCSGVIPKKPFHNFK